MQIHRKKKNYSNVLSILITGSSHPCIVIVYISNIFIYTCINSEIMHYNYPYLATLFVDYAIPIPNESSCTYICSYFIGNSNISFELLKTFINIFEHIKTFTEEHSMLDLAPTFGLLGTMIKQQPSIYLFVISQVFFYFPHPFTIFFFIYLFIFTFSPFLLLGSAQPKHLPDLVFFASV